MGDGALRGLTLPELIVAERRGLLTKGAPPDVGLTAELGGALGAP